MPILDDHILCKTTVWQSEVICNIPQSDVSGFLSIFQHYQVKTVLDNTTVKYQYSVIFLVVIGWLVILSNLIINIIHCSSDESTSMAH